MVSALLHAGGDHAQYGRDVCAILELDPDVTSDWISPESGALVVAASMIRSMHAVLCANSGVEELPQWQSFVQKIAAL